MAPKHTIYDALVEYDEWRREAEPALLAWSAALLGCALTLVEPPPQTQEDGDAWDS